MTGTEKANTTRTHLGAGELELVRGDIAAQPDMDAVVNAANAQLRGGRGSCPRRLP